MHLWRRCWLLAWLLCAASCPAVADSTADWLRDYSECLARGFWLSSLPHGDQWQPVSPERCPRCNILHGLAARNANGANARLKILLLSDSVDRYVTSYACEYLQGEMKFVLPPDHALHGYNVTAYGLHFCVTPANIDIAASYFPGVHPTGPYHRALNMNYTQRIDFVAKVWPQIFGSSPDMVVVSSLFWDIARMSFQEPEQLESEELSPELLRSWERNFTRVVQYAQSRFPDVRLWGTHTYLAPRMDARTGRARKSYLGHAAHLVTLNALVRGMAPRLRLCLVDYAAVGERFASDQAYLRDEIHPNRRVSLEIANVYFNLITQLHGGCPHPTSVLGGAGSTAHSGTDGHRPSLQQQRVGAATASELVSTA